MVEWLSTRAASTLGLSKIFVTGNPDNGNYRANQLLTRGAIVEFQKDLEKICDWCFYQVIKSSSIYDIKLDDMSYVSWEWRGLDDLDENTHQDAITKMLKNSTSTYKDILGNDWREKLTQTQIEINWFKSHNLPHPSFEMVSGGERTGADVITQEEVKE